MRISWSVCVLGFVLGCSNRNLSLESADPGGSDDAAPSHLTSGQLPDLGGGVDLRASADLRTVDLNAADLHPPAPPSIGAAGLALVAARPYGSKVPSGYDASRPTPLILVLHGFGFNGAGQAAYLGLVTLADQETFLLAYPDGTLDQIGQRFWNATDACCDLFGAGVDDVSYLTAVIDDMRHRYNVDDRRVFVVGHSNGGFMSHRLACDISPRIAGIVSLAGAVWKDPSRCQPTSPVAVLEVHGTADAVVAYGGGSVFPGAAPFPGAVTTIATWADKNGCGVPLDPTTMTLDIDATALGSETVVTRHNGCPLGAAAELWTMQGVGHVPVFQPTWAQLIYDFLRSHPKP